MPFDLFISYSRRDNERGQVTALKAQIEASFSAFAGRDLRVFFDTHEIAGMDDWRQKIQRSLRDSQVFLAVLSPRYVASPYCHWEWEDYVRYEAMRQCLGEVVAPVFFVTLPAAADPKTDQAIARWIDEIQRRQTFDLRPWNDAGEQVLEQAHVKKTLEELNNSVRDRLNRSDLANKSPNNLIKHNPAFVGRVRELTDLRNALTKNKLGVVGAREGQMPGRATVQGLGGMGKTELALAYAHAFAWDYPGGRWQIPCEHVTDLRVALLHLANANAFNFEFTQDEKKNIALAFERVLRELNLRERCLLILDNVSDPNLLQPEYLDRLPRDGRVDLIATTRLAPRAIPGAANGQTFIAVDELPEEDALALMRSHQPEDRFARQQEDDEARAIVRLLRGFTLAVETAAIYLGRDTAPDACRRFRERLSPDLLRESEATAIDSAVAVRHRVRSLEETLAFTLQTLTPEALHLLEIASLLPADQIALPWLKSVGAEKFPAFNAYPIEPNTAFGQAEELLRGLRLFQSSGVVDEDGRLLVARMHRLVQQLVAQRAGFEKEQALERLVGHAESKCKLLEQGWLDWSNRWEIEPLRALAEELLALNYAKGFYLAHEVARHLHRFARYAEAEPLMRRVLANDEARYSKGHPIDATAFNNLACLLGDTNRLGDAEALMRSALAIDEACHGKNHPIVATDLNNLAQAFSRANRLAEAEPLYRRALAIDEAAEDPDHRAIARDLTNLGALLMATNRLTDAESLMRRAIAVDEASLDKEHPEVGTDLNNLATLLHRMNRLAEAEPLIRRALAISEAAYGQNHPYVATQLNNLAQMLLATNRLTEAESLIRRALAISEAAHSQDHPEVATCLGNLATLLFVANRLAEAEPLYRRALLIFETSYGRNDPNVAFCLNNLARLLQDTNRLSEAELLMRRALAIREASCGEDHPEVAISLADLATLLQVTSRLTEAAPLYRRALDIFVKFTRLTGQPHPHFDGVNGNYRALLTKMGGPRMNVWKRFANLFRPPPPS